MSFEHHSIADVMRIAGGGGGLTMAVGTRSVDDLVRIAGAASARGARIVFTCMTTRAIDDLVRVGGAGKGAIVFED
jgi:hypothetical protein